jgi:hypothetical protein
MGQSDAPHRWADRWGNRWASDGLLRRPCLGHLRAGRAGDETPPPAPVASERDTDSVPPCQSIAAPSIAVGRRAALSCAAHASTAPDRETQRNAMKFNEIRCTAMIGDALRRAGLLADLARSWGMQVNAGAQTRPDAQTPTADAGDRPRMLMLRSAMLATVGLPDSLTGASRRPTAGMLSRAGAAAHRRGCVGSRSRSALRGTAPRRRLSGCGNAFPRSYRTGGNVCPPRQLAGRCSPAAARASCAAALTRIDPPAIRAGRVKPVWETVPALNEGLQQ